MPWYITASCILLTFILPEVCPAQFAWKLNGEAGYLSSASESMLGKSSNLLGRLEGQCNYNYTEDNNSASVSLKLRPELYEGDKSLSSLKGRIAGNYSMEFEKFGWDLNITAQKQLYRYNSLNADFSSVVLQSDFSIYTGESDAFCFSAGYATNDIKYEGTRAMDMLFFNAFLNLSLNPYVNTGPGIYLESFICKSPYSTYSGQAQGLNKGLRFGPELSFNYLHNYILSFNYRYLLHKSDLTNFPSGEHLIRFMTGKSIGDNWTIFLLADYYTRNFSLKSQSEKDISLLYTPLDLESHIYVKLGYDIKENLEIYTKYGYSAENLYINNNAIKGWNLMLGLALKSSDE